MIYSSHYNHSIQINDSYSQAPSHLSSDYLINSLDNIKNEEFDCQYPQEDQIDYISCHSKSMSSPSTTPPPYCIDQVDMLDSCTFIPQYQQDYSYNFNDYHSQQSEQQSIQCFRCNDNNQNKRIDYSSILQNNGPINYYKIKLEPKQNQASSYSSEEETCFEEIISQNKEIPIFKNYYQILLDYERRQKQEEVSFIQDNIQENMTNSINQQQQEEVEEQTVHCKSVIIPLNRNDSTILINSKKESEEEAKIVSSNKKNVVKNIMSAFKNFVLEPTEHKYEMSQLQTVLAIYNNSKVDDDDISEMQAKFKRYITSKNFNHYTVKLLIQHINYSPVFKYFLDGPANEWVQRSKVADIQSHMVMIEYLKKCYEDIQKIELLKRHEKKRAHYQ